MAKKEADEEKRRRHEAYLRHASKADHILPAFVGDLSGIASA